MSERAVLLRELEIALDAVRAGIEAIAARPEMMVVQTEFQLLRQLVDRAIEALEALQADGSPN